jgi:hypothetical protein
MSGAKTTTTTATRVLLIRGVPAGATDGAVLDAVKVFGPVESVRVVRDRRIAFAEFAGTHEAHDILALTGGRMEVLGASVSLEFSHNNHPSQSSSSFVAVDWTCPLCRTANFARRDSCFSCRAARPPPLLPAPLLPVFRAPSALDTDVSDLDPTTPPVIAVRGLADGDAVREYYTRIAPVKGVRFTRDRSS